MKRLIRFTLFVFFYVLVLDPAHSDHGRRFVAFDPKKLGFEGAYPKMLTLPNGSLAKRDDKLLLLRFDSVPPLADLTRALHSMGYSICERREGRRMNNSIHLLWIGRPEECMRLQQEIEDLSFALKRAGAEPNWISPAYQLDSVTGDAGVFVPMPGTLMIKSELVSEELCEEVMSAGIVASSRTLPGYTFFSIDPNLEISAVAIGNYLRWMPEFGLADAYFFEMVPLIKPVFEYPNDPIWPHQKRQMELIHLTEAWKCAGTNPVKIGLIDYGCNLSCPDLNFSGPGRRVNDPKAPGSPHYFADQDHGTNVAGLLGAIRNNNLGMAGVAGTVSIYSIALVDGTDTEIAEALVAASEQKVNIVNMSVGSCAWRYSILDPMISYVYNTGILICAAAGNDRFHNWMALPAINPRVMAIGGSDGDRHFGESNYGDVLYRGKKTGVSVVAPGTNCTTINFEGREVAITGTSAACPIVAGVAALIKSRHPLLTSQQIRAIIERSADKVGGDYGNSSGFPNGTRFAPMGHGRVNALAAMQFADTLVPDHRR